MTALNRRDVLKLAGGASMALAASDLFNPFAPGQAQGAEAQALVPLHTGKIDYRKAVATPTICYGCTTHCGVIGWVQDGRVRKIEGNPLDPNSQGKICSKANGMLSYTYYPERLIYPIRRVGKRGEGKWKRISWDEALDEIAARLRPLRDNGVPEQFIFHYGRDKTKGFTSRFTNAFGTPNRLNRRAICSSNRRVPLMSFYGREFEWESQDVAETRYIVNFGGNPMEAYQGGLYMMHRIQSARVDHGAKLITFEVRPSATASVSDEYYPIMPGTDGIVALAMAQVILEKNLHDEAFWNRWANYPLSDLREHLKPYTPEAAAKESGVPAATIRRIAVEFAASAPRCCTVSNRGSAKHYNGVQADRAIRMLDVLVGNVGKPGGFCLSTLRMWNNRYGQEGLPVINQPAPRPKGPQPWLPGTREFNTLPPEAQARVAGFPEAWQKKYFGELATPSLYPLSWHYYNMRVGQMIYPYIRDGVQKVGAYMSYVLGASYGYPEANVAREVLQDESLIPFHVAIDIGYSEQAALADIVLPEATSLERWDAHSTNNYGLIPYTGIRQPLVEPPGEARPIQIILRDLARRIGGGMEAYFDFEEVEDYYREWYKNVPMPWEEFKKRGIWMDAKRPKDYELYERPVPETELANSTVDSKTGVIYQDNKGKKRAVGIVIDGKAVRGFNTPSRKIQVYDDIFPQAATLTGLPLDDVNASPLAIYQRVPEHEHLQNDQFIFTTFKWNVHTQGRSGHWKYHAEIIHANPAFMHPGTGRRLGLKEGDEVDITVYRPKGHTYRSGEDEPVGVIRNRVRFLKGMHERVIASSHHVGHWEHGPVGRSASKPTTAAAAGVAESGALAPDNDVAERIWWAKDHGGVGGGVHLNDALPINPCPLVGGQNWYDNVCSVKKVSA